MLHSASGNQWQSLTEEAHSIPNRLGWHRLMAKRYVASARRYRTYSRSIQPGCVHDDIRIEAVVMIGDLSGLSKMLSRCRAMTMSANDDIDDPAIPLELRHHASDVTLSFGIHAVVHAPLPMRSAGRRGSERRDIASVLSTVLIGTTLPRLKIPKKPSTAFVFASLRAYYRCIGGFHRVSLRMCRHDTFTVA